MSIFRKKPPATDERSGTPIDADEQDRLRRRLLGGYYGGNDGI